MSAGSDADAIVLSWTDPSAFSVIFERHFVRIHGYLARRAGSIADDLAAEVFTIAFARRRDYDPSPAEALPWLYGIASNLLRARYRRLARDQALALRVAGSTGPGRSGDPQEQVAGGSPADAAFVEELLDRLSEDDATTLVLYAWEDLSYEQIAEALDVPVGTVRSRLNRVRRIARELRGAPAARTAEPTHDLEGPHGR